MWWHRYLQTSGVDEAKLTWKLYWQLKVSQVSYFWPVFPKWAVAQFVKGRHREHLNHRFAGSNPDTAELRLAHIFIFSLPSKCWFVKSFKFSDFSRWYFFLKINFFKGFFFIRSDDSNGLFTKFGKSKHRKFTALSNVLQIREGKHLDFQI